MKAISLFQPWATLLALGVKGPETRSWSTSYRGPLAIHAAKTTKGFDLLPGDCDGTTEAGWRYGYVGDYQVGYCYRGSDEGRRGDTFMVWLGNGGTAPGCPGLRLTGETDDVRVPLGAVVATATLVDVVPTERIRWGEADGWRDGRRTLVLPERYKAYGDYSPGRFAWLFQEVRPTPTPIPARGAQGLWNWSEAA